MRILVTGSDGFLGTHFRKFHRLEKQDITYGTILEVDTGEFKRFNSNYSDIDAHPEKADYDCIIHFAAVIPKKFGDATYENTFIPNCDMMRNLMEYSLRHRVSKFIYLSSFGSMVHPERLDVKDYYTLSKVTGEHFCAMMTASGINAVSLRISAPYGEHMRTRSVIRIFIENCLGNKPLTLFGTGSRRQNFTYAGNIVRAIERLVNADQPLNGVYNIVDRKSVSMLELAKTVKNVTGSDSKIVFTGEDPQEGYSPEYSFSEASEDFGYQPETELEEGVRRYASWLSGR